MKRVAYILALVSLVSAMLLPSRVLAASATLYLSPSSASVIKGNTLTVAIRENSGGAKVNAVQANLTYSSSLFDISSINSSSAFGVVAQNSYGNGSIQIGRGALPSVSGDQLVATVVFKAKSSSGVATVNFASGSAVTADDGNGTNILSGTSGGNYSLQAPTAASISPTTAKDTTPPVISAIKVQNTTTTTAVIVWTTSEPATSEVDYGVNNGYGLVAVDAKLVTEHKLTLSSPIISPATTYHFGVKSIDAAGNQASSSDQIFRTQGGVLKVTVLNQKNKPLTGAIVSFAGQSVKTDKNGKASLDSLPAGELTGFVELNGSKTAETINIKTADPSKPQTAVFKIKTPASLGWLWVFGIPIVGLAAWLISRRRNHSLPSTPVAPQVIGQPDQPYTPPSPIVVEPSQPPSDDPNPHN